MNIAIVNNTYFEKHQRKAASIVLKKNRISCSSACCHSCECSAFLLSPMRIIFTAAANLSRLIDFFHIRVPNSMLTSILFSAISMPLQIIDLLRLNCSISYFASNCSFFLGFLFFLYCLSLLFHQATFFLLITLPHEL